MAGELIHCDVSFGSGEVKSNAIILYPIAVANVRHAAFSVSETERQFAFFKLLKVVANDAHILTTYVFHCCTFSH